MAIQRFLRFERVHYGEPLGEMRSEGETVELVMNPDRSAYPPPPPAVLFGVAWLRRLAMQATGREVPYLGVWLRHPESGNRTILFELQENVSTQFRCEPRADNPCNVEPDIIDNVNACASLGISTEEMTVTDEFLAANVGTLAGKARVAAVFLHEIAHNKGYTHHSGTEKKYSVNEQVEACVESLILSGNVSGAPNNRARSAMTGEAELQQIGGAGAGSNFMLYCPPGTVAWGQGIDETIPGSASNEVKSTPSFGTPIQHY